MTIRPEIKKNTVLNDSTYIYLMPCVKNKSGEYMGVMYCTMNNIMQGKENNMFAPKDNATRAEIAAILQRFIEGNK